MPEYRTFLNIVSDVLQIETKLISTKSRFTEDLGANDLEKKRIMLRTMEVFDVEISSTDIDSVETVGEAFHLFHPAV